MAARSIQRRAFLLGAAAVPTMGILANARSLSGSNAALPLSGAKPLDMRNPSSSLSYVAQMSGRYYGAAARIDQIAANPALADLLKRNCSHMTPEIHLKWNSIEWNKGEYNFAPVDGLLNFARANNMAVRGHTLIWGQSTPAWAETELRRQKDWRLLADYFRAVLSRYQNQIHEWDVVNEPIDTEHGVGGLRQTVFAEAFGPTYIERALEEARALAPNARLIINDYGFDYDNPVEADRRRAFLSLVKRLRLAGVPLNGVGVQAHLDLSKGPLKPAILRNFVRALADEGIDVTITELDVKEHDFDAPVQVRDSLVADETRRYLEVVLDEPSVRGVVTWGLSDKYSWLSQDNGSVAASNAAPARPLNRGLPCDKAFEPKPMYYAIRDTLSQSAKLGSAFASPGQANAVRGSLS